MKQREFIHTTAGLSVIGFLPKGIGSVSISENQFISEAHDNNKAVCVYNQKVSEYNFSGEQAFCKTINKDMLAQMLSKSIIEISGEKNEASLIFMKSLSY
jgi:hypothetical protein